MLKLSNSTIQKLLFTGASGYLGSSLINAYDLAEFITVIDRTFKYKKFTRDFTYHLFQSDLSNLGLSFANHEVCIHAANLSNLEEEQFFLQKLQRENPNIYLVYLSSSAIYGEVYPLVSREKLSSVQLLSNAIKAINLTPYNYSPISEGSSLNPLSSYGLHKLETEKLIRDLFPNHLILRITNPYGGNQEKGFAFVVQKILESRDQSLVKLNADFPGQIVRDFIHIDFFTQIFYSALQLRLIGTYNLSGSEGLSLESFIERYQKEFGVSRPLSLEYLGANPSEIRFSVLDNSKLLALL